MNYPEQFEYTAVMIASLDKEQLKNRIRNFEGRFNLDFSDEYLDDLSVEKLRHILLAALLHAQ